MIKVGVLITMQRVPLKSIYVLVFELICIFYYQTIEKLISYLLESFEISALSNESYLKVEVIKIIVSKYVFYYSVISKIFETQCSVLE